ncbi:MAG: DSD1 family PLP-dependent enzyme [Pseudomonadota bacterium]|nr:DSD1 family PLP-dependent enzyme [Pseudomonadota bacterium]
MNSDHAKMPPHAGIGMPIADVDTPALLLDLDAFERNLARMAGAVAGTALRLRPHSKTHKSPVIARMQIERGAVGVCCQKVSEAEVMLRAGIANVLVSNEVIGRGKLDRLAALSREAEWIGLCVDHPDGLAQAEAAARDAGVVLHALVEIDVGAGRCGIAPGEPALALAQAIDRSPHLAFAGLQAYQGAAQHIRKYAERKAAIDRAADLTRETIRLLERAGIDCPIVGGAGTGTFRFEAGSGVYNELQSGSYIFMDADYGRNLDADGSQFDEFENALFVYATVMSRPGDNVAVVDAGHKSASVDSGMPVPFARSGLAYGTPSDEHGVLRVEGSNRPPELGEKILLVPGHCDPTVNLHDWYVCVRGMGSKSAHVEDIWPVAARGMYF